MRNTGLVRLLLTAALMGPLLAIMGTPAAAGTAPTPAPTPATPAPGVGGSPAPAADPVTTVAILVLGAVALVVLYVYLHSWRLTYERLVLAIMKQTGSAPGMSKILGTAAVETSGARGGSGSTLQIAGLPTVEVGRPSTYRLTLDEVATSGDWTVDSGPATVSPGTGEQVTMTASAPGEIVLRAEVPTGAVVTSATIRAVAAVGAAGDPGNVPVVGDGYGAFTIAIIGVTVAAALTAAGWLPGAALATLLGTVVSYFFVQQGPGAGNRAP